MTGDQEERQRRAARNQLLFRSVNEQILNVTERLQSELSDVDLVCECADPSCTDTIRLAAEEFGQIDRTQNAFILLRGHEDEQEDVVDTRNDYVIVRKRDLAARIVEEAR